MTKTVAELFRKCVSLQAGNKLTLAFETEQEADAAADYILRLGDEPTARLFWHPECASCKARHAPCEHGYHAACPYCFVGTAESFVGLCSVCREPFTGVHSCAGAAPTGNL